MCELEWFRCRVGGSGTTSPTSKMHGRKEKDAQEIKTPTRLVVYGTALFLEFEWFLFFSLTLSLHAFKYETGECLG